MRPQLEMCQWVRSLSWVGSERVMGRTASDSRYTADLDSVLTYLQSSLKDFSDFSDQAESCRGTGEHSII